MPKSSKLILGLAIVLVVIAVGGVVIYMQKAAREHTQGQEIREVEKYQCPMHPAQTSDRPGDCPICGMKLVPVNDQHDESAADMPMNR